MSVANKPVIEYAGGGPLPDAVIQQKLRHAPRWVHIDIDRHREQRGLPPLFAKRAGVASSRSPAPAAPARSKAVTSLTCLVAPGISEPLSLRDGEPLMAEHITADAWRSALASIKDGRPCEIQCGHAARAHVLGRSGTPAVRFVVTDTVGLVVTLDMRDADTGRRPDTCSIGFKPLQYHVEHHRGLPIRVIDDLLLDHVALGERWNLQPAYPLARIARSMKWNARSACIDAVAATMADMRRQCPFILAR
jgi:hypothetical protein